MQSKLILPIKRGSNGRVSSSTHIGSVVFDVQSKVLYVSDGNDWNAIGESSSSSNVGEVSRGISDTIVASGIQALKSLVIPAIRISPTTSSNIGSIAYDTATAKVYYGGPTGWIPIEGIPVTLSSVGSGTSLVNSGISPNLSLKSLISGVGISITPDISNTEVTIAGAYTAGANITIDSFGVISATGVLGVNSVTAADNTVLITGTLSNPQIQGNYVSGSGISIVGNQISNTGIIILEGGTGISVTGNTITNIGVTSLTGTTNEISVSASTGDIVVGLPSNVITNILSANYMSVSTQLNLGGVSQPSFLYASTGGVVTSTGVPADGQLLIGSGVGDPVMATISSGPGISVTNGSGSITISNTGVTSLTAGAGVTITPSTTGNLTITASGTAGVGTFQTTLSGLSPSVATGGAITLSGILGVSSGGTGLSAPYSNGQLLIGNTISGGLVAATLQSSTGISIVNGNGTISIGNSGVTSLIAGSGISVSSSTGNITITATGAAGVATFRTTLSGLSPSVATGGAVTLSGVLGITSGGTGLSASYSNGQLLIGNTISGGLVAATLQSTSGISIVNGNGTISIGNSGVTSLTGGAGISVSSSTGNITITATSSGVTSLTNSYYPMTLSASTGNISISRTAPIGALIFLNSNYTTAVGPAPIFGTWTSAGTTAGWFNGVSVTVDGTIYVQQTGYYFISFGTSCNSDDSIVALVRGTTAGTPTTSNVLITSAAATGGNAADGSAVGSGVFFLTVAASPPGLPINLWSWRNAYQFFANCSNSTAPHATWLSVYRIV